jgi:hypothetical protein
MWKVDIRELLNREAGRSWRVKRPQISPRPSRPHDAAYSKPPNPRCEGEDEVRTRRVPPHLLDPHDSALSRRPNTRPSIFWRLSRKHSPLPPYLDLPDSGDDCLGQNGPPTTYQPFLSTPALALPAHRLAPSPKSVPITCVTKVKTYSEKNSVEVG